MTGNGVWEMGEGVWAQGKTTAPVIEVSSQAFKNMFRNVKSQL